MMSKQELLELFKQVDDLDDAYVVDNSEYMLGHKVFSDNERFADWLADVKRELKSFFSKNDFVCETVKLADAMSGNDRFNEQQCFGRLKHNLHALITGIDDFFPTTTKKFDVARYGPFAEFLNKANLAYSMGLGAGSMIYLRKILEAITTKVADSAGINYECYEDGEPRKFQQLMTQVDEKCSIIPSELRGNRKAIYKELSTLVHGKLKEDESLKEYNPLERIVVGIVENVRNREDFIEAKKALGWDEDEVVV